MQPVRPHGRAGALGHSATHSTIRATPGAVCARRATKLQRRGALGSKTKGSSLPHCSFMPNCWNFAVRAFCRWQASCTIWSVELVGFGPVLRAVEAVGADVVAVVAV